MEGEITINEKILFFPMIEKIYNPISSDQILRDLTQDIISNCCKEDLWEEMDGLNLVLGE